MVKSPKQKTSASGYAARGECEVSALEKEKEKKLTIRDIAALAGVSKTTVSFYLNGKTEKMSAETGARLHDIIEKYHYTPNVAARMVNRKQSLLIGVIIGDITNSFSNQIVKGIEDTAREQGYQILIGNSSYRPEDETGHVERMLRLGVDGFIIQPSSQFQHLREHIRNAGKPLVYFDSKLYASDSCWVKTDNYEATCRAIETCIALGYRSFLMIGAKPSLLSTRIERSAGFLDTVNAHRLPCAAMEIAENGLDLGEIHRTVQTALRRVPPLLVYVPNCWALPSVFTALQPLRSEMPKQLGLIGFDNTEWTQFSDPRITTIVQPAYAEGRSACRILLSELSAPTNRPVQETLECTVNWEGSTL